MYFALKHIHLLSIALSAILLSVRYALITMESDKLNAKILKIAPHVVDTVLILSGVGLVISMGFVPFTPGTEWFTEKVTCILAYFALTLFVVKIAKGKLIRAFAFFGALGWLFMAGNVAVSKVPALMG
ncbi:SirB2 family protein [Vibrio sp. JC009]|uniref:SirB2 family protein n=1 Tax=Vibrio sp. JC009 TaxID=2912314 RepID=UPI0023AF1A1F|nr:SirB2 family protein [Vibrio sp. JC009]WED22511.1 SirB2 family protein [Vibrio sp. JC009]